MISKISYFIIFGIIIFTNGNLAHRQDFYHDEPQYEPKTLIEVLVKQGKDNVMFNYPENRGNHEDLTKNTYNVGRPNNHDYNDEYRIAEPYQSARGKNLNYNNQPSVKNLHLFVRNKLETRKTKENDETVDCMKKWGTCTELVWNYTDTTTPPRSYMAQGQDDDDDTETRNYSENEDDVHLKSKIVLKFLNDLDRTLKLDGKNDIELRCYGNDCSVNKVDNNRNSDRDDSSNRDYNYNIINENYDKHLRCNGKRCSIHRNDDYRNYRDNLRCYGNRCSRKTNDRDDYDNDVRNNEDGIYKDIYHILRTNRDDSDENVMDSFRCIGDRCSKNRNDDDGRDTLRCIDDRCRDRDDRGDIYDGKDDRSRLRCVEDRCGRNRDDNEEAIYCTGNRCGRSRPDEEKNESKSKNYNVDDKVVADVDKLFEIMLKTFKQNQVVLKRGVLQIIQSHFTPGKPSKTPTIWYENQSKPKKNNRPRDDPHDATPLFN